MELGDALKVAVAKPPEGGAANKAVVALLVEALGVVSASVQIVQGHFSPRKPVLITVIDVTDLRTRLDMIAR